MFSDSRISDVEELCELAQWAAARGWVPATSGNFSVRDIASGRISISRSGQDKGRMMPMDLLQLNSDGRVIGGRGRPSAESGLHVLVYQKRPEAHAIAHVHTVWNTLLSTRFVDAGKVDITGYELLKGLAGVETHRHCERVPVIANSQDYQTLALELDEALENNPLAHGVLLSAHGLYTWGRSVAEARRHLEALEFLFEV
ncbi:MAG TPA: methylthioribulose 1-phosphate dehydratase, partial [Terracidiphilus sp.]